MTLMIRRFSWMNTPSSKLDNGTRWPTSPRVPYNPTTNETNSLKKKNVDLNSANH